MRSLLVLGTTPFAMEVADVASEVPGYQVAGFVENLDPTRCPGNLGGLPVLWVDEVATLADSHWAVCGLGTTHRSRFTEQVAAHGLRFATLVHPLARVSAASSVGRGSILSVGAIVAAHARLGDHVLVNRAALIGHHTEIGDYTTIGPGANVAGSCHIGEATYIGIGAVVIDHVTIGDHVVVGAGAVVTQDVPDHVLVVGVPAKIVKEGIPGK